VPAIARRVRWGLLSTARINERVIPAMRTAPRSELLAVASQRGSDAAQTYATRWQIPRAYGDYDRLLADPEIDAVYISLPNALHATWSVKAAAAGKHVLCEKPLALSAPEVDQIIDAARRYGVVIQEAVMMRHHPQVIELQKRLSDGAIGDVRLIRGVFTFNLSRPGDIRFDPALGGGSIWDLGGYPVSFIRTMLRADPVEVHGWQTTRAEQVDMSFAGQMRFASGALAQFITSFQSAPHSEVDILGSTGRIYVDLPFGNKVGIASHILIRRVGGAPAAGTFSDGASQIDEETLTFENIDAYRNEIDAMIACILDGTPPVVPLEDSRGTIAALNALCVSARESRPTQPPR